MSTAKYLQVIGEPAGRGIMIVENQTVKDIINLMRLKHLKHAQDYDKIASDFWKGSIDKTAQYLFDWCKSNIRYVVEDEEKQTVSSPAAILSKRQGDCKHYALFIGGILDALVRQGHRINWFYRYASYNPFDVVPGHVFVVVKRSDGSELWIDPVLKEFDFHKPYMYAVDKKVRYHQMNSVGFISSETYPAAQNRARLGLSALKPLETVGATTAQTGAIIQKVSPALAAVPVIGWAAAAAGSVVGWALTTFGYRWNLQWSVRWLIQLYQYYVLGQTGVTGSTANEALVNEAVSWFSHVLGVPVLDRTMFDELKGTVNMTLQQINTTQLKPIDQRVQDYLSHTSTTGVTQAQALAAAQIAATMDYNAPPGGWKGMTVAPALIDKSLAAGAGTSQASILPSFMNNKWILIGGAAVLLYFILNPGKKKPLRA